MKKLLLLLFVIAINSLNCQVKLVCEEYLVQDTNILFIGYSNILKIGGTKKPEKYKIVSTNSDIVRYSNSISVRCHSTADTISIFQNNKLVYKKIYCVKNVEKFKPKIGNINDSIVDLNELLNNLTLTYEQNGGTIFRLTRPGFFFIILLDENKNIINKYENLDKEIPQTIVDEMIHLKSNFHILFGYDNNQHHLASDIIFIK